MIKHVAFVYGVMSFVAGFVYIFWVGETNRRFNLAAMFLVVTFSPLVVCWVICRYLGPWTARRLIRDAGMLLPRPRLIKKDEPPRSPREIGLYD